MIDSTFEPNYDKMASDINSEIANLKKIGGRENDISDGYHTFGELYEFRKMYNAALFNEWAERWYTLGKANPKMDLDEVELKYLVKHQVHKSLRHYDGELCFGGGWFIVSAILPTGQISNHYKVDDWDLFNIPSVAKSLYEFDGHTPADVLDRLKSLCNGI